MNRQFDTKNTRLWTNKDGTHYGSFCYWCGKLIIVLIRENIDYKWLCSKCYHTDKRRELDDKEPRYDAYTLDTFEDAIEHGRL